MKKNNKLAVSAVIGVILMVAITVAIAATVYVYIEQIRSDDLDATFTMEGWIIKAQSTDYNISINNENYTIWKLNMAVKHDTNIEDTVVNYAIFTDDISAPPDGVKLRLYYTVIIHEQLGVVFDVDRLVLL